jgi:pimeloyl-ACP methyl ester carboxylesterase
LKERIIGLPLRRKNLLVEEAVTLYASDGMRIEALLWHRGGKKGPLIVVAPGFSQNKDTPIMRRVSEILADYGEVLCVDFRGTGQSEGRYHFGAEEHLDLEAALRWARRRNHDIELVGFSMGAYIALRAASEMPGYARRLYFVSGPTRIEEIVKTLGPLRQGLSVLFKPDVLKVRFWAGSDYFFRWGTIFKPKPRGEDLAAKLKIPISVLVGGRDQLVLPKLSRRVFEAAQGRKLWTEFPQGHHAEYMAVMQQFEFREWFLRSRNEFNIGHSGSRP